LRGPRELGFWRGLGREFLSPTFTVSKALVRSSDPFNLKEIVRIAQEHVERQTIVEHLACMAHIRRKFFESKHALPERTEEILDLIRQLYGIEAEAREAALSAEERLDQLTPLGWRRAEKPTATSAR